jgi:hypothetical protein
VAKRATKTQLNSAWDMGGASDRVSRSEIAKEVTAKLFGSGTGYMDQQLGRQVFNLVRNVTLRTGHVAKKIVFW